MTSRVCCRPVIQISPATPKDITGLYASISICQIPAVNSGTTTEGSSNRLSIFT